MSWLSRQVVCSANATFPELILTVSAIILNKQAAAPVGEMSSYARSQAVVSNAYAYVVPPAAPAKH